VIRERCGLKCSLLKLSNCAVGKVVYPSKSFGLAFSPVMYSFAGPCRILTLWTVSHNPPEEVAMLLVLRRVKQLGRVHQGHVVGVNQHHLTNAKVRYHRH
jgi:hypothetical protein